MTFSEKLWRGRGADKYVSKTRDKRSEPRKSGKNQRRMSVRASSLICSRDKIDSSRYFQKGRDSATEQKMTSPSHTETGKKKKWCSQSRYARGPGGRWGQNIGDTYKVHRCGRDITFLLGTLGYFEWNKLLFHVLQCMHSCFPRKVSSVTSTQGPLV